MYTIYLTAISFKILASLGCAILCFLIGGTKKNNVNIVSRFNWNIGGIGWAFLFISYSTTIFFVNDIVSFAATFDPRLTMFIQLLQAAGGACVLTYKAFIYFGLRKII